MWFKALKSFHDDSRVPGWPCHCYLKPAIFDPLFTREKDGRGQIGPKSCFPINIDVIRGDKEFPRWFQAPCLTLPLWPDFDLKISHFWPPCAHEGRMAGAKTALNHVCLLVLMWFEVIKSFHDESPSQTDPAIVTWFWPKNHPFLRPPCSQLKHGNGQNCFKPTWYMSMEDACSTDAQSKHIYGRDSQKSDGKGSKTGKNGKILAKNAP